MIYVINGSAQSGKDTFCQMVSKFTGENFTKVFSTVELVKQAARDFGWDGEKTARARKFLSDLKDLLTDWDDIPYKDIERKIRSANADWEYFGIDTSRCAIFVMCREPEEIRKFVDRMGARTILIRRREAEDRSASNHADAEVLNYKYDIEIENNGSLKDLAFEALKFVEDEDLTFRHWVTFHIKDSGEIIEVGKELKF